LPPCRTEIHYALVTKLLLAYSLAQCLTDMGFVTFGLLKALLLAAFTWWLCGFSMWLWNRRFEMRPIHHVFCAFAAAVTLVSIFLFQCLGKVEEHALIDLKNWQNAYSSDGSFGWETFLQAHDKLQQIYQQNGWQWDSQKYLEPPRAMPSDQGKYILPLDRPEACEASLKIYSDRAVENLALNQPVLSQILWKNTQISLDPLREDLADFQRDHPVGIYSFTDGSLRVAGELCLETLNREVAKQVRNLRWALIGLFLLAQSAAFGLAGYSAYSGLKIDH
jgi:hypothetical protein